MPPWLHSLLGIVLPSVAITTFFVLLTFSSIHLNSIERAMRLEAPHNMLWVVSQAHAASLRLADTVKKVALGDDDLAALQRRFDVFLSRVHLMRQGPQRRELERLGMATALDRLHQHLPRLQAHIATLTPHDTDDARIISPILAQYNDVLNRGATKAMVTEWDNLGGKLEARRKEVKWIIFSLVGIFLAGILLIADLAWTIRSAQRRTRLLNREKAFSELVISSSGEGIVAVDMQRHCTIWNRAAEALFQCSTHTATGRMLDDISGFFQTRSVDRAIARALAGEAATLLDQPFFPDMQGAARYVDLSCFALYDGADIIGCILLLFDVTERRASQREIAMHRDHLEELVDARTRDLNAVLERERAAADLYRNFGTMISHQFRTPLAIVDSALQRLVRRGDRLTTAEVRERSTKARDAITRLAQLIESTLDAARLDAGQVNSRSQPCDLGNLATSVCALQRNACGRDISLRLPATGNAIVHCDRAHAEHILANLVSNAIKYSAANTPISVHVRMNGRYGECTVINQGSLALAEGGDTLFQRYYRGGNAKGHTGIGIGLYMARALARLQRGDVELVDSAADTVAFCLRLPRSNIQPTQPEIEKMESA